MPRSTIEMNDTQWPRFMVFQQEAEDKPFVHNGTVHAPDIEMALLNARDVFARRPEAVAMWVVPANSIYTQTREELSHQETTQPSDQQTSGLADYLVFAKFEQQEQCRQVGEVLASSPPEGVKAAIIKYADQHPLWWWVFPKADILTSRPQDSAPMYEPARAKTFIDQAEYPVVTMMREIRAKKKK
jgi:ring-1,2-phenylacetyl-CoA epoxidase subunit PaaB